MKEKKRTVSKPLSEPTTEKESETHIVAPVVEEFLTVSKEIVENGKILIQKRVTEEEAAVNLPIIQEAYIVDRRPGTGQLLTEYPSTRYEGEDIIIPVIREVLVIEKRYEVTEELREGNNGKQ